MKTLALVGLPFMLACHADVDVADVGVVRERPEQALTDVTITHDCDDGGTLTIDATLDKVEEPFRLALDVSFTYAACVDQRYGTVNGTVTYRKLTTRTETRTYETGVAYQANVRYDATACAANVSFDEDVGTPTDVTVAKTCRHPAYRMLDRLEKECRVKTKDDCELHVY